MSDILPTDQIDFEEPPPIARKSEHLPLLLALKGVPGRSARIQKDVALSESDANKLATALKGAARKIGNGYKVVTRFIPAADHFGVWVTYEPAVGDEPVPSVEAAEGAAVTIAGAMNRPIPVESTEVDPDDDIDPIGEDSPDDSDWELPERSGART